MTFRDLHFGLEPLLLPNAWDAGSARLIAHAGAKAIATTSAGVAWSLGYPDGDLLPVRLLTGAVTAIARVIDVPLSVDMEGGYSGDLDSVEEIVGALLAAGAAGINLEDGAGTPDLLCAKIERARRAGQRAGVDVFINARTDVYLAGLAPEERRVEETLSRAGKYREAGADGIFVPAVVRPEDIRIIASSAGLPLNVLAVPGLPGLTELTGLGVKRLSAGSGIARLVYSGASDAAAVFLHSGSLEQLGRTYAEINALMKP